MFYVAFDSVGKQIDITSEDRYRVLRSDLVWYQINDNIDNIDLLNNVYERNTSTETISLVTRDPEPPTDVTPNEGSIDIDGLVVSEQLYFEGGGINSSNITGWTRRFNGLSMSNQSGMLFENGALIETIELTSDATTSGRRVQLWHYDIDGNDGQLLIDLPVTQENNQFLFQDNMNLIVPARRRFAVFLTGANFNKPQFRIGYRRLF